MKINTNLLIAMAVTVLAVCFVLYILRPTVKEGFEEAKCSDGTLPTATQSSSIPTDVAGSTTSNPTIALASPSDIQALSGDFQTLGLLVFEKDPSKTDLDKEMIEKIQNFQSNTSVLDNQLKMAYTNPELAGLTSEGASNLRQQFQAMTNALRNAQVITGPTSTVPAQNLGMNPNQVAYINQMPTPNLLASPPGKINLQDLIHLRDRINQESLALANLRSTAPTMNARQNQLEELAGNLTQMITDIERGTKSIQDIPITHDEAQNFLGALDSKQQLLPALNVPLGMNQKLVAQEQIQAPQMGPLAPPVQELLNKAQYMKWNLQINVSYDPEDARLGSVLKRLEEIEKSLTNFAVSDTKVPREFIEALKEEMRTLQAISTKKAVVDRTTKKDAPITDYKAARGSDTRYGTTPEYPSRERLNAAQDRGVEEEENAETFPQGGVSPDVYRRPGFPMNSEQIARRASGSTFDPATVAGPDYKARALELCRQAQSAGLGDPASFGCIADPNAVSSSYSWKGNYQMVCNRIGDTWGGWYPEMFGCPPYDPQQKFKGNMM